LRPSRTLGAWLVTRLRMQVPEGAMLQRAQEAFALMQVTAAPAALLQLCIVAAREGWYSSEVKARLVVNLSLSVVMLIGLFGFTRRGRIVSAARFSALGMVLFDLFFAWAYGLRGTPTPYVVTLAIIAIIALVERPRLLACWSALYGAVLFYGLLNEPRWIFTPNPISLASGVLFTLMFFCLFLVEFRAAMEASIGAAARQADSLASANADLHRTIAERDALSSRLATSQRVEAMGRMAGSIAHDFNNLLTVIRGYADLVAEDTPRASPRRTEVDLLVQAVGRASNVTREVLDFAAPRPITTVATDIAAFVRHLSPSFRQLLAPRAALAMDVPDDPHCVAAIDRAQLERLLLNLVTNARDVTPEGAVVRVDVSCDLEFVSVRITDRGPGVPATLREQIFEPFFTTKGTTGGTGLGLASSFSIARQHGGCLRVDDADGGGAVFTLTLPMCETEVTAVEPLVAIPAAPVPVVPRPLAPTHPLAAGRPLDGMRALLVEDDAALRRLATRLLERAGASVEAFDNGSDAVARLRDASSSAAPIHVLVTDLRLPSGSGADVIDAARALTPSTAIVAISGFLEDADVAERAAKRELRFLHKPFSERHLLDAIDEACRYAAA
jgi:signal transduction histidine kinase/ActR/RegA family two-component response regulator